MQKDFHYYATYCAALLAGYTHVESAELCYSAQLVDCCSRTLLEKLSAPKAASTTQLPMELANARTDLIGLQDITRIWASFHFLPYDLHADVRKATKLYRNKYRLICKPNGALVADTVELAKEKGLQAAGIAMHVLADTWAHSGFAGTPSLVINNTNYYFYELLPGPDGFHERPVRFRHNPGATDNPEECLYTNSVYQGSENSLMNLGHGRAGHLPDYSFMRYKYLPAWGDYAEIVKDNPSDYFHAFSQMVYALKYLHGDTPTFTTDTYDTESTAPWKEQILSILTKRQVTACEDWKSFGQTLSGRELEDFNLERYQTEYLRADSSEKDKTFLGTFILAAMAQKSMVTNKIFKSGNMLAGFSVDFTEKGFRGIRDYRKLVEQIKEAEK